ncbi:MAG: hypothetical protein IPK26_30990 [Planctomycetes bacterium]|nr:hypothetical protein [Planctomycetota bacterium]
MHPTTAQPSTPTLTEHCLDAGEFLLQQHMPWVALLTMAVFPLVVGIGGFLTAGGSPMLLAGIAAVPGFLALAVVGAMGRRVLIDSSHGSAEVPRVTDAVQILREATRFATDFLLVFGPLLGPSWLMVALGAPAIALVPGALLSMFFVPMTWGLRQVRGDFASLSPTTILRAIGRCGGAYAALAGAFWAAFAPAMLTAFLVSGRAAWLQIAVLGPLLVLPVLASSRLLGTWLDAHRLTLGILLGGTNSEVAVAPTTPAVAEPPRAPVPQFPVRPAEIAHFAAPTARVKRAPAKPAGKAVQEPAAKTPAAKPPAARPAAPAATPNKPAAASTQPPRKPAPAQKSAAPRPAAAKSPATSPAADPRQIEGRAPARPAKAKFQGPDLSGMPGATTVSGNERAKSRAATRHP